MALGRVYLFGSMFRADKFEDPRHYRVLDG